MRRLTEAEKRADLLAINKLLDDAKDDLALQVTAAQRTAISKWLAGAPLAIRITRRMLRLIQRLYRSGQGHALAEALAMGVTLERAPVLPAGGLLLPPLPGGPAVPLAPPRLIGTPDGLVPREPVEILRGELSVLGRKVERDGFNLDVGLTLDRAQARQLMRDAAGARNVASQVVSPAFHDGLASVYIPNAERFEGWQYSSALDSKACGPCLDEDGREFGTLQEALAVLPRFGGNPYCHGGNRCRCRLHPITPLRLGAF